MAQCFNRYGDTLGRFAVCNDRGKWGVVCYDPNYAFLGRGIGNEKQFFDSLGVMTFREALKIACNNGLRVEYMMLSQNRHEWVAEGHPGKRKYGKRGPGDYKELILTLRINSRTGRVKHFRKEWIRNPTFF